MPECNAKPVNPTFNGAHCTVTIELRALDTDLTPVRSFSYTFPISDSLADVKRRLQPRIQDEWEAHLADVVRQARVAVLTGVITGASLNFQW